MASFLDNFLAWVGESECPTEYLKWSAISLVAACMGNRCFVRMRIGATDVEVYPNLFTILVGPSANFKSFAISRVLDLLGSNEEPKLPSMPTNMNLFTGRITAQGMYDNMRMWHTRTGEDGKREHIDIPQRGQLYIINDELANGVGLGERATTLIMSLTEMYLGGAFDDQTRLNGHIHLENYSINWLAATTPEWMRLALNRESILGGFLGRVIIVAADRVKKRIFSTERAHNWHLLEDTLRARCEQIMDTFEGAFIKTPEASSIEKDWYMSRPDLGDDEDATLSNWRRQQALALKLALILSVINGNEPHITGWHMQEGIQLAEWAGKMLHIALPAVVTSNQYADGLLRWIEKRGTVSRTDLNRAALSRYGWRADELDRWTRTWHEAGIVIEDRRSPQAGGTKYTYKGKSKWK